MNPACLMSLMAAAPPCCLPISEASGTAAVRMVVVVGLGGVVVVIVVVGLGVVVLVVAVACATSLDGVRVEPEAIHTSL